jgi:hypothetical protein
MKRVLIGICCVLAACGQGESPEVQATEGTTENNIQKVGWILGSWYMDTPDGVISEEWSKADDSTYTGFGMMQSPKGDTLFSEHLKVSDRNGVLWYIPRVSNQNDGKEVLFKETAASADSIVFENPEHDFPQRIVYHKTSDSTIHAYIEGVQEGKNRKEEFNYIKR